MTQRQALAAFGAAGQPPAAGALRPSGGAGGSGAPSRSSAVEAVGHIAYTRKTRDRLSH